MMTDDSNLKTTAVRNWINSNTITVTGTYAPQWSARWDVATTPTVKTYTEFIDYNKWFNILREGLNENEKEQKPETNKEKETDMSRNNKESKAISLKRQRTEREDAYIDEVKILAPGKVVEVIFKTFDGGYSWKFKQVCKDPDTFDLRFAVALAIVKYLDKVEHAFPYQLTNVGREIKAREFCDIYETTSKAIDQAIKSMKKKEEAKERYEKEKAEAKAIKERKRAKNRRKREQRRLKTRGV